MEKKPTSGLAVASLVTGIIALFSAFVPLLNLLSFPFVILAIIFGAIGIWQASKGTKGGKGLAIAGLVLGVLGLLVTFAMYGGAAASSDGADANASGAAAGSDAPAIEQEAASPEAAEGAGETAAASYAVSIDGCRVAEDYRGNPVAVVTYTFTNNSDEDKSFALAVYPKVFQDGVEIGTAIGTDWDSEKYMSDVKPGATTTVEVGYALEGSSDITVEVSELMSFDDVVLAEKTFSVA